MTSDVREMYDNLNKLLQDICAFLSDDKLAKLSPNDRKVADNLIQRSKTQLSAITKISLNTEEDDRGSYVDMSGKTEQIIEDEEKDVSNIYSYVDDNETTMNIKNDMMLPVFTFSPFKDLSARDMCRDIKTGTIQRQVRIAFFQTYRRMFAGIHNKWFLVYGNEKASRPCLALELKYHRIEELKSTQNDSMLNTAFTIYSITEEKKKYCFSARTNKDMQQWIVVVNRIVCENANENEPRYTLNLSGKKEKHKEMIEDEQPQYLQIEEEQNFSDKENFDDEDIPEYFQVENNTQSDTVLRNVGTIARSDIEPVSYQEIEEAPSKTLNAKSESRKQILLKLKGKQPLPPLPPTKFFKPDSSANERVEEYDDDEDNTEVVYEQIVSSKVAALKPNVPLKPKMIANRTISMQSSTSKRSTVECIEYEQVDNNSGFEESEDSFSDGDDEPIYDQVITLK